MRTASEELISLRLGAFRLARRRGRTRDAAWAASRLRLHDVRLDPADARFARAMRVRLGRALRVARNPGRHSADPNIKVTPRAHAPRSRRRPFAAALVAALMLLALLALDRAPAAVSGQPDGAAIAPSAIITTRLDPLRGRTQPGLVLPIEAVAQTAERITPPAAPALVGAGDDVGGIGTGGSGGGSGTGNGAPIAPPAPTPTAAPTPFIDPQYLVHVTGRVVDGSTRTGLANVCISYGTLDCGLAPSTDATGAFDVPLDGRSSWIFRFIAHDYAATSLTTIRLRPGPPINVGTVVLRRAP